VLGLIFTLIKGKGMNLLGSDLFDLDLIIVLTAYLALSYSNLAVALFAFGQGFVMDLFSAGLNGLFASIYLVVFCAIYFGGRLFDIEGLQGQVMVVSLSVLLKKIVFIIFQIIFSARVPLSTPFLIMALLSALGTGIIAPLFFRFLDSLMRSPAESALDRAKGEAP